MSSKPKTIKLQAVVNVTTTYSSAAALADAKQSVRENLGCRISSGGLMGRKEEYGWFDAKTGAVKIEPRDVRPSPQKPSTREDEYHMSEADHQTWGRF